MATVLPGMETVGLSIPGIVLRDIFGVPETLPAGIKAGL